MKYFTPPLLFLEPKGGKIPMPEKEALTSSSLRLRLVKNLPKLPNHSEFPISASLILEKGQHILT